MQREWQPTDEDILEAFVSLAQMHKEGVRDSTKDAECVHCVAKCKDLCARFRMSATQLANFWESLQVSESLTMSRDALVRLESALRTQQAAAGMTTPAKQKPKPAFKMEVDNNNDDDEDDGLGLGSFAKTFSPLPKMQSIKQSPNSKKRGREEFDLPASAEDTKITELLSPAKNPSNPSITATSRSYLERKDAGKLVTSFPPNSDEKAVVPPNTPATFEPDDVFVRLEESSGVLKPYRYMFDTIPKKDAAIQERQDALGKVLLAKHDLTDQVDSSRAMNAPHQNSSVFVGEIASEGEGLSDKTIELTSAGGAVRVRLDVANLPQFSLFSGQVVAIKGINGMGTRIVAEQLFPDAAQPHFVPPPLSDEDGPDESELRRDELRVIFASGPFTTRDDMKYYPLNDLLDRIHQRRPHAVILMGPFVDAEHPEVAGCTLDRSFEDAFDEIITKISSHLENLPTRIVLVPSLRDVTHDDVFPQPPFELRNLPPNIECVPNPTTIRINGVSFGLCSNDVIKHITSQLLFKGPPQDRVPSCAHNLLLQRSYYPVRPSPSNASAESQLDYTQWSKCNMPYTPDVLLLCSNLPTFIRPFGHTLCVNAGRLVTGKAAGQYLELNLAKATGLPEETASAPGILARMKAALVKI